MISPYFHFGEFFYLENLSKVFFFDKCMPQISIGSNEVFDFCLKNKIKLIYSATSAKGNKGNDKNLSPYAFTKAKNLEFIKEI